MNVVVFKLSGERNGIARIRQIASADVDDDPHRRRSEELVHVPARVGDRLEHEKGLEHQVGRIRLDPAERRGTRLRVDQKIDRILHERMVG